MAEKRIRSKASQTNTFLVLQDMAAGLSDAEIAEKGVVHIIEIQKLRRLDDAKRQLKRQAIQQKNEVGKRELKRIKRLYDKGFTLEALARHTTISATYAALVELKNSGDI